MTSPRDEGQDESLDDIRRDEQEAARSGELFYGNVNEFVVDRLVYLLTPPAPASGRVWCTEWYRHAQALSRLDSLWRAWEMLRFDPSLGMSNWWLHHADPHWAALTDPVTGPFAQCVGGHRAPAPVQVMEPPDGLFFDQRQSPSRDPFALD
ncbi:DUF4913 domain-containing protein [Streptomyces sp. NBC_00201]|uniref:DUF4913 domain-containing protein n=1 Tax=Streptomyces sp. NBC_00201 TaxID=2975679 RepID=UPI002250E8B4|nr:DUF4913 domain-containing protein [Streptomyces sp. NBC_00201]MCX5246771.1 DUF4913 domain-containing protein [Streptomyces sp. NBC_00201]